MRVLPSLIFELLNLVVQYLLRGDLNRQHPLERECVRSLQKNTSNFPKFLRCKGSSTFRLGGTAGVIWVEMRHFYVRGSFGGKTSGHRS